MATGFVSTEQAPSLASAGEDEAKPNAPPAVVNMEVGETEFIKNMTGTDESV
eukprot:CAMPEP_0119039102 /NCGR_PEP_ID=MMETSP1177-20130426/8420_1 /TAXON_ID=2985 /ORGANISM="Ochromonas sp, Strain CCMP1899" /LENGTH=51 /DNA_ID=CAMNT_0007002553 /DNA_START=536 /DNA_END=691 /DNA_ORIENTATION=+